MRNLVNKLKSKKGESLAEVFVAILIAAVALLLLSSMIYAATHIVAKGDGKMAEFYAGISAMESKEGNRTSSVLYITSGSGHAEIPVSMCIDEKTGLASYEPVDNKAGE